MASGWATRERRDRQQTDRHADLVRAARETFERVGFERAAVARVAEAAGVSRATFYVYFASLDEALHEVAREVRDDLLESQRVPAGVTEPCDITRQTMATFLDARVRNLRMLDVIEGRAHRDPRMAELWVELTDHPLRRTARFVRRLADAGAADPAGGPEAVARAAGGLVTAYAPLVAADPDRRDEAVSDLGELFDRLIGV